MTLIFGVELYIYPMAQKLCTLHLKYSHLPKVSKMVLKASTVSFHPLVAYSGKTRIGNENNFVADIQKLALICLDKTPPFPLPITVKW